MTKAQRKAYKADNRQRREVEAVLARLPKPRSKTSLRKRFEAAHDEWRATAGLDGQFTGPAPVLADALTESRSETEESGVVRGAHQQKPRNPAINGNLAAGSVLSPNTGSVLLAHKRKAVVATRPASQFSSPGPVCTARAIGPAAPPEGGGPGGVDDERNP